MRHRGGCRREGRIGAQVHAGERARDLLSYADGLQRAGNEGILQHLRNDQPEAVAKLIEEEPSADEREAVAMEFVRVASRNDAAVTDELRARLAQHFTPPEVMEIVLVTGFWKMYNMMHVAMAVPIEHPVQEYKRWVEYNREPKE